MLTLFAIPKAFCGHIDTIQRNAIRSWTLLQPRPEIILLGNDPGTAAVAQEFGLKHIPDIECNEYGTPLMSSLFGMAQRVGSGSLFAYVNADIILMQDFMAAIAQVPFQRFMLTGQRWNVDIETALTFEANWQDQLHQQVLRSGRQEGPQAMDYFVFSRDTYTDIPPFAIGRLCWDNWMLYKALNLQIPLVDASQAVTAVHQNHDYNHHPAGREGVFLGPEAARNLELLGGQHYTFFMLDLANWQITPQGLRQPGWTWERLDRHLDMLPLARPSLQPIAGRLLKLLRSRDQLLVPVSKVKKIPARIVSRLRRSKPSSVK
ncbi:hypothetical protein ACN4EK_29650 [Pantanalinema rosaneae CENA516]|uniref:hypothetical protein n=1 Tax=Pantanalinema rosaneae TaxID=1620701 RepID=UPI003D6F84FE